MPGFQSQRVAIWTVVASVTVTAGAVAVNLATGSVRNPWAWAVVVVLTIASGAVSLHLGRISELRQEPASPGGNVPGIFIENTTFNGSAYVLGVGTQFVNVEGGPGNDRAP
jgi:hypothetical protein